MTFYKYFASYVNLISKVLDFTSATGAYNEVFETMQGRDGI